MLIYSWSYSDIVHVYSFTTRASSSQSRHDCVQTSQSRHYCVQTSQSRHDCVQTLSKQLRKASSIGGNASPRLERFKMCVSTQEYDIERNVALLTWEISLPWEHHTRQHSYFHSYSRSVSFGSLLPWIFLTTVCCRDKCTKIQTLWNLACSISI